MRGLVHDIGSDAATTVKEGKAPVYPARVDTKNTTPKKQKVYLLAQLFFQLVIVAKSGANHWHRHSYSARSAT